MPVHPELVTLLRDHLDEFGNRPGRRIFTGPRDGVVAEWTYLEVFHAARRRAERNNWPAAAGLDEDELDEPGYRPFSRYRPATGTSTAADFHPAAPPGNAREIA